MSPVETPVEKWSGAVREVTLGAGHPHQHGDGGRRDRAAVPQLRRHHAAPPGGRRRDHRRAARRLVVRAAGGVGRRARRSRRLGGGRRREGRRPDRPEPQGLPPRQRRHGRARTPCRRQARAGRRRRAAPGVRPRRGRQGQRRARGRGRGHQGRAAGAGHLRGEELPHHRGRRPRQRPRGDRRDAHRREPGEAAQHPHLRHGPGRSSACSWTPTPAPWATASSTPTR